MKIKLSVVVMTYNHEKYIKECLDSIFEQKVSFPYEVIIGDDCSKDDTVNVIREHFQSREELVIIERKENLGMCGNLYNLLLEAKGEYIYTFSGDDYLYGDDSLQKLVEFLDTHPEYVNVSTTNLCYSQQTGEITESKVNFTEFSIFDFLCYTGTPTTVGLVRNFFKDDYPYNMFLAKGAKNNEEIKLTIYILDKGMKYIINEPMHVYRQVSQEGESNYCSTHTYLQLFEDYYQDLLMMEKYYGKKYNFHPYKMRICNRYFIKHSDSLGNMYKFLKRMKVRDLMSLMFFKVYLKFHNYSEPPRWHQINYIVK